MRVSLTGIVLFALAVMPLAGAEWYKGVTHIHSLWSDGDTAPEVIAAWYKERGYDFIAFSDHNVLQEGEKYVSIKENTILTPAEVEGIRAKFGEDWVTIKDEENSTRMKLKTHEELVAHFEEPGEFILFPGEEVTSIGGVHLNALNIREVIPGEKGNNTALIQSYIDQINAQREKYGVPMIAHVNHINFSSGVTIEELLEVRGLEFFEVYNGHPSVDNWGNAGKGMPTTDVHWDVIQSFIQLRDPEYILYGVSTDDSHNYKEWGIGQANPGRGWVMVNAETLEAGALLEAMEAGKFYATTGVMLETVEHDTESLRFTIQPQEGVTYTTQFIGTMKGFDETSEPVLDEAGNPKERASRRYSQEVGRVLKETKDLAPSYEFTGEEMYVRAKIVSDKLQENPFAEGDYEMAWVQPVLVK